MPLFDQEKMVKLVSELRKIGTAQITPIGKRLTYYDKRITFHV